MKVTTTTRTVVEYEEPQPQIVDVRPSMYERAHEWAYVVRVIIVTVAGVLLEVFVRSVAIVMQLSLWALARGAEGVLHVERELGGARNQLPKALPGIRRKQLPR